MVVNQIGILDGLVVDGCLMLQMIIRQGHRGNSARQVHFDWLLLRKARCP